MAMIWITSDLHFGHNQDFIYAPRGFSSVRAMNIEILNKWNSVVDWDDDVYVLGDLMLNDNEDGIAFIKSLHGRIHVILGNHDTDTRIKLYQNCYNIVEVVGAMHLRYKGQSFFLCHYPTLCSNFNGDKPLNRRLVNLCGHTHTKDSFADWDKGLIYHCELDAHNCTPVSLDQILEDCNKKFNI